MAGEGSEAIRRIPLHLNHFTATHVADPREVL